MDTDVLQAPFAIPGEGVRGKPILIHQAPFAVLGEGVRGKPILIRSTSLQGG
jgi:hypothetical protein